MRRTVSYLMTFGALSLILIVWAWLLDIPLNSLLNAIWGMLTALIVRRVSHKD